MVDPNAYELVDFGGGARLERFAGRLVDRPYPGALGPRRDDAPWRDAELRFDRDRGWQGLGLPADAWSIAVDGLTIELRPTEAGQIGVFPEHLSTLGWLGARVAGRVTTGLAPSVLHLFAYTGLATLAMAAAGAAVTHVDASKPTVAWARRNAERSGQADRPIRWIVDDAIAFAERELRRGRQYAGVVLDPPSYGHGPTARPWRLEADLPRLLAIVVGLLEPDGFVLLTAHTPGFEAARLSRLLEDLHRWHGGPIEGGTLSVTTADGRALELGAFARSTGGA